VAKVNPLAIIGAGAWGSALALAATRNHFAVQLFGNDEYHMQSLIAARDKQGLFLGTPFPQELIPCKNLEEALTGVDDVLIVVPSQAFTSVLKDILHIAPSVRIGFATKGLAPQNQQLLSDEVINHTSADHPIAVLSGPSFASEVARDVPTAVVIASNNTDFRQALKTRFDCDLFRISESDDLRGVSLCGVMKNVMAIAVGISDGLNYGANARSALITHALQEMQALGQKLGADDATFTGLAGVGDLVLTATDDQSRNRRFGLAIGQGMAVDKALADVGGTVEGVANAPVLIELATKHHVTVPICQHVVSLLRGDIEPETLVKALL